MASRKKQLEGIALLSMYNDDDDEDMEYLDEHQQEENQQQEEGELPSEQNEYRDSSEAGYDSMNNASNMDELAHESTAEVSDRNSTPMEVLLRPPTPQMPQVSFSSSPQQQHQQQRIVSVERKRNGRGRLTIVDYAHDELAMSPEQDEGQFDEELQTANAGASQEKTPPGNVQVLTPNVHTTSLSSEHLQTSQVDEMNNPDVQSEAAENEGTNNVPAENDDPLDKFLPPPPKDKCPEDLQRKIDKFIALKKVGRSFNAEVRNRKDYRNPDFLQHAVRYQEVDEIGSCFSKDVFDPHGYDLSDFYHEIEVDMRREKDRKDQELKKSPKVEFMSAGTQPGQVIPPSKFSLPIPVASAASGGLQHSASTAADAVARDGRQNKKSKWDKVDGDGRNSLPTGGQDSLATHAAILSASNVGAGYSAFVQQKRREAEERRSSEKKLERRS